MVRLGVIGHDALDRDPVIGIPADRGAEEGGAGVFGRPEVGEPGGGGPHRARGWPVVAELDRDADLAQFPSPPPPPKTTLLARPAIPRNPFRTAVLRPPVLLSTDGQECRY